MKNEEYMTREDVIKDIIIELKKYDEFKKIIKEDSKFAKDYIKKIIQELYDLKKSKISSLNETNTYITRKLYGILDNGKCITASELNEELNLRNTGREKKVFIKKIVLECSEEFKKKKIIEEQNIYFKELNLEQKFWHINSILNYVYYEENHEKLWDINNYVKESTSKELETIIKETKIFIRREEDLYKMDLTNNEIKVLMVRFGIFDGNPKALIESKKMFGENELVIRKIENKALSKIKHKFLCYESDIKINKESKIVRSLVKKQV